MMFQMYPVTVSFVSFFFVNCRYSGRTETELMHSEVEREEPEVERGSSKRYPARTKQSNDGNLIRMSYLFTRMPSSVIECEKTFNS